MRKSIISAVMTLAFAFSELSALAVTDKTGIEISQVNTLSEITLEVTDVKNRTIRLKDEDGKTYSFQTEDKEILDKVKVGDTIKVELEQKNDQSQ
ncbi:MAG: hypothetical protein ACRENF_03445 [Thermodesulfobacteriota bacterium]